MLPAIAVGELTVASLLAIPQASAAITVPGAPTGVKATPGSAAEHVYGWTAVNGGSPITGYTVTAALLGATSGKTCHTTGATACTVTRLLNGDTYKVSVRASNAKGTGPPSIPIEVIPGVPSSPIIYSVIRHNAAVAVQWSVPTGNGSLVTGYTVTASPGGRACTTAGDGKTDCTVTGLTDGTPYSFTVAATNARGTGPPSAPSAFVTPEPVQTIHLGGAPTTIYSDGTHVWVAEPHGDLVAELDASDGSLVRTISVSDPPDAIVSDGTHVWVALDDSHTVTELNTSDGSLVQNIIVGTDPSALSADGTHVWVANDNDNTVTELAQADGSVVGTFPVGPEPLGISSDGAHVWVADGSDCSFGGQISELSVSDGSLVRTITGIGCPASDSLISDGTHVWVAGTTELNAADGSVIRTVPVGGRALSLDGTHVWIVQSAINAVAELKESDGSLVQTIATGSNPWDVSSDGTHVWVANRGSDTVTAISS